VIAASLQAYGVVFPLAMPTSICRSIVTICSGLYLCMGMTRFSSKWILSHSTWYKKWPATSSGVDYVLSGTTEPIGALTQVTYGSGDSDNFSYDTNTDRLTQYNFTVGASQSVIGNLAWNANGTLGQLAITDQANSSNTQTCNYTYDDLARVANVNCGFGGWGQSFSGYDVFGNIKKAVPTAYTGITFQPTYNATTNRFSSIPGASVSYDADGNLLADGSHAYTWDAEGRPHTIDSVTLVYDAFGRMLEQQSGSGNTEIVYGPTGKFALMNGQALRKGFALLPGGYGGVRADLHRGLLSAQRLAGQLAPGDYANAHAVLRRSVRSVRRGLRQDGHDGLGLYGAEPGHGIRTVRFHVSRIPSGARPLDFARSGGAESGQPEQPPDVGQVCVRGGQPTCACRSTWVVCGMLCRRVFNALLHGNCAVEHGGWSHVLQRL
jgi:hypothetical protein